MLAYALLFVLVPQQITDTQSLRDPAPGANPIIPRHEAFYGELAAAGLSQHVRPGSAGRAGQPHLFWERTSVIDHIVRLHGKGPLSVNLKGLPYDQVAAYIYQTHIRFHTQAGVVWRLPEFRLPGTVPGVSYSFDYYDRVMQRKLTFQWWKYLKETGIFHPKCLPGGPWEGRCLPPSLPAPLRVRLTTYALMDAIEHEYARGYKYTRGVR